MGGAIARFVGVALAAWAIAAQAESIGYELYELGDGGSRALLAKGVRQYTLADVTVSSAFGQFKSAEIPIANGFSAGTTIFPEADLTGFGLWLKDRGSFLGSFADGGFSWDWFNREEGAVYRKLQGAGRVRVTYVRSDKVQEIASVEVLEDITLRVDNKPWFFFKRGDTHNMVISRGSILRFQP